MISAVGVVIPARDEAALIGDCLRALGRALRQLPTVIDRAVCVVADRCADDTARVAKAEFHGWCRGDLVINRHRCSIGEVRDLGMRRVRAALSGHPPSRTLLLSTDADSTVAPDWARRHVACVAGGIHAVAGVAELADVSELAPRVRQRYGSVLADARRAEGHGNVYGANLGVRADAYTSVGGFQPMSTGEDHDLWHRLERAGYRLCYASDALVTTSSRLNGRAPSGLAHLLQSLHNPAA